MKKIIVLLGCLMFSLPSMAEVTAEPGKGVVVATEDKDFVLKVRPRVQLRYTGDMTWPENQAVYEHSFLIRRARLAMTGNMFGPDTTFKMELGLSPKDLGYVEHYEIPTLSPLLDFYVQFNHLRDLTFRAGQYKVPFNRQRVISSGNLQMVDRSLAQGEFNLDRDIGADARSKDLFGLNLLRYYAGVYMSQGRDNFQSQVPDKIMVLGRGEVLPFGLCDDYKESAQKLETSPCLSIGAAYAWLSKAQNVRGIKGDMHSDLGITNMHVANVDGMFKWYGTSLFSEFFGRYGFRVDGGDGPFEEAHNAFGGTIQAGQMILVAPVEVTARYSFVRSASLFGLPSSSEAADEAGVGVSWYPGGHSLKVQADLFKTWSATSFYAGGIQSRLQIQAAF